MAKMGRPKATNPKTIEVKVRIDASTEKMLEELAAFHNTTKAAVIRLGVEKLYAEIKK